jgi:hypothetical protein
MLFGQESTAPSAASLHPNPAKDLVTIKGMENGNYVLYDSKGQKILEGSGSSVNTSGIASGWYLLKVSNSTIEKQFPVIIN